MSRERREWFAALYLPQLQNAILSPCGDRFTIGRKDSGGNRSPKRRNQSADFLAAGQIVEMQVAGKSTREDRLSIRRDARDEHRIGREVPFVDHFAAGDVPDVSRHLIELSGCARQRGEGFAIGGKSRRSRRAFMAPESRFLLTGVYVPQAVHLLS